MKIAFGIRWSNPPTVSFDPAPPYRVRHTATMTETAWRDALFAAEERLGRRLDEMPS